MAGAIAYLHTTSQTRFFFLLFFYISHGWQSQSAVAISADASGWEKKWGRRVRNKAGTAEPLADAVHILTLQQYKAGLPAERSTNQSLEPFPPPFYFVSVPDCGQ